MLYANDESLIQISGFLLLYNGKIRTSLNIINWLGTSSIPFNGISSPTPFFSAWFATACQWQLTNDNANSRTNGKDLSGSMLVYTQWFRWRGCTNAIRMDQSSLPIKRRIYRRVMNRSRTAVAAMKSVIALAIMTCAASRGLGADLLAMSLDKPREIGSSTFDVCAKGVLLYEGGLIVRVGNEEKVTVDVSSEKGSHRRGKSPYRTLFLRVKVDNYRWHASRLRVCAQPQARLLANQNSNEKH